jgi:hypothetical protein
MDAVVLCEHVLGGELQVVSAGARVAEAACAGGSPSEQQDESQWMRFWYKVQHPTRGSQAHAIPEKHDQPTCAYADAVYQCQLCHLPVPHPAGNKPAWF